MGYKQADELIKKSLDEKIKNAKNTLSDTDTWFKLEELSFLKNKEVTLYVKIMNEWSIHPIQKVHDIKHNKTSTMGGLLENRRVPFNKIIESIDIIMEDETLKAPLCETTFLEKKYYILQNAPKYFIGKDYLAIKIPLMPTPNGAIYKDHVLIINHAI